MVFLADLAQRKISADYKKKDSFVPGDLVRGLPTGDDERPLRLPEERRLCYGIGGDDTKNGRAAVAAPHPGCPIPDPFIRPYSIS